jgi:hypothetical protein
MPGSPEFYGTDHQHGGGEIMNCPECGAITSVVDSRPIADGGTIRRRRLCPNGHRGTSYEMYKDENVQERITQLEAAIDALRVFALASVEPKFYQHHRWRALCDLLGVDYKTVCVAAGLSPGYLAHAAVQSPKPLIAEMVDRELRALIFERLNPAPSKLEEIAEVRA